MIERQKASAHGCFLKIESHNFIKDFVINNFTAITILYTKVVTFLLDFLYCGFKYNKVRMN